MRTPTFGSLVLLGCLVIAAGCVADGRIGDDRGRYRYDRTDQAWEIVRNDPCRNEEYRRFAERHRDPEKRRHFVETLAREGCRRYREDPYRPDPYRKDPYYSDPYRTDPSRRGPSHNDPPRYDPY